MHQFRRARIARIFAGLSGFALALGLIAPSSAQAETIFKQVPQDQMKVVLASSQESVNEGTNGAINLILDGNKDTYWHSQYSDPAANPPHYFIIDLGSEVKDLSRIVLTPRQSSNSSGRVHDYSIITTTDARCAVPETLREIPQENFEQAALGEIPANPDAGAGADVTINFDNALTARCVWVLYNTTWGGDGSDETTATLAEFNAYARQTVEPEYATSPWKAEIHVGDVVNDWTTWADDTPAAPYITKDGSFYAQAGHALYSKTDGRSWSFFTGKNMDSISRSDISDAGTNPDTTALCNNSPTGKISTYAPDATQEKASHSERNYCDVTNIWVDPDTGDLYGLVHNEFTPKPFADGLHYDSIDWAYSTDEGKTWTIDGHAITSPYSTDRDDTEAFPEQTYLYGDGDPRVYTDYSSGYFYAFYGSRVVNKGGGWVAFYSHVARAPISGKMKTGTWQKYYDGTWEQPGIGGMESNLVPVNDQEPNGYTQPEKAYDPSNPGNAQQQIDNGLAPATSPLFVMDISYNAYLGLYIGEPQNPDQSGNAPQEIYATANLATQRWYKLGDTGDYKNASWYRWFLDSGNLTSNAILGKDFRSYCWFGCSANKSIQYVNLSVETDDPAQAVDVSKAYTIANGDGTFLGVNDQGAPVGLEKITEENGTWTFKDLGDGSYSIASSDGKILGVDSPESLAAPADAASYDPSADNAGRAWDAPLKLEMLADSASPRVGQQWFVMHSTSADDGSSGDTLRLVNRYSGQALGFNSEQVATTPQRSWDTTSESASVFKSVNQQLLTLGQYEEAQPGEPSVTPSATPSAAQPSDTPSAGVPSGEPSDKPSAKPSSSATVTKKPTKLPKTGVAR